MDFIEKLPELQGYDSILVVVDCATKGAIYIAVMNHDNGCIDRLKDSGLKSINGLSDKETTR